MTLEEFHNFFYEKRNIFAYTIASLIGFLFIDIIIRGFFIRTTSLLSFEFLINTIGFIVLIVIYYELIIKGLSHLILVFLEVRRRKAGFWILGMILILAIIFHYKYEIFEQPIIDFLEKYIPWIKKI